MSNADTVPIFYAWKMPDEASNYKIFPSCLEDDELVFFHGTDKANLDPIQKYGFKSASQLVDQNASTKEDDLASVSYSKTSALALNYACKKRSQNSNGVVIAVKFKSLCGLVVSGDVIHAYNPALQPEILGYCIVPAWYKHV